MSLDCRRRRIQRLGSYTLNMKISSIVQLFILLLVSVPCFASDAPTPAIGNRFALPLADGSTTHAVFLAGPFDKLHLVYATQTGQLVVWSVSKDGDDIDPPPPPPPPPVKSLLVAVVHAPTKSTVKQRQVMANPAWRAAIPLPHSFCGIIPIDYVNPNTGTTPPEQNRFIKAAKGAGLPCLVLLNENNEVVFVCPLPANAETILKLIQKHGGATHGKASYRRQQPHGGSDGKKGPPRERAKDSPSRLLAA